MLDLNTPKRPRYMKISQKSGCISVDYNLIENDTDSVIVPYDDNERSGLFLGCQGRA
ncbi:MAG TPA: hypothetical protein PK684_00920 [Bacillota bacterium]|jgi:hypothetical protein|nr:hypothetical protein [Bacillota bacterium]